MNLNFIDSDAIGISEDLFCNNVKIGPDENHPIITIDNVFKDPHKFIENVIEKIPLETAAKMNRSAVDGSVSAFPGIQTELRLKISQLRSLLKYSINNFMDFDVDNSDDLEIHYQLNIINTDEPCEWRSVQPHVDPSMIAFTIYLNEDSECKGGTSFYSHDKCGIYNMEHVNLRFKREEQYWEYKEWEYENMEKFQQIVELDKSHIDSSWKEEYHVPMKFNRMVIYPSYIWHTAVYNKEDFVDKPRISISGFIRKEYFTGTGFREHSVA